MTMIGLYFHLASIIISLTYLNSFALVSVFFVFFTNITTRLFEDEKSIIVISSVVGTLMPFGGFMDNAVKTVLYTINLGDFHTILHTITFFSVPLHSSTDSKPLKPRNFTQETTFEMDFMLNLLFQHSIGLGDVHMLKRPSQLEFQKSKLSMRFIFKLALSKFDIPNQKKIS